MKQPIRKSIASINFRNKKRNVNDKKQLDGSGLEIFFKVEILDKLGVKYEQQFEAKSIGRFYDFYLPNHNVLIEIDGSYWHSDPRLYSKPINAIQKRNKRVDEIKNKWALINGYVLIRLWEKDIIGDTVNVLNKLSDKLNIQTKIMLLNESKRNGSFFMKKNN